MLTIYTQNEMLKALRRQALTQCDESAARRILKVARCIRVKPRHTIIKQDKLTNDIFFILQGSVDVFVSGTKIASRTAGEHVGEMAALLHSRRTATVVSREETVLARVRGSDFLRIAETCPIVAMNLANVLAARLNQRRNLLREPNIKPFIFIGSSKKHQVVAERIRDGLKKLDAEIQVWSDQDAFSASDTTIETLTAASKRADFAILVFGKDDLTVSKGHTSYAPRDNVVFEAGLFIGAISRQRTFLVRPKTPRIKILTDLSGVTLLDYKKVKEHVECGSACAQITAAIQKLWVR